MQQISQAIKTTCNMWVDLRKRATSCKVPNFGTFKPQPFQSSEGLWLYSWLWVHQVFYFTNPMVEAVGRLLSEAVAVKQEG